MKIEFVVHWSSAGSLAPLTNSPSGRFVTQATQKSRPGGNPEEPPDSSHIFCFDRGLGSLAHDFLRL